MKKLKLLEPFSVILRTGNTTADILKLTPAYSTVSYNDVVDSDVTSKNYNKLIIDRYIDLGILTIVDDVDNTIIEITDIVESKTVVGLEQFPGDAASWQFSWPIYISSNLTSVVFNSEFVAASGDNIFIITVADITTTDITFSVTNTNKYNSANAIYDTVLTINGVTVTPTISIEYILAGS